MAQRARRERQQGVEGPIAQLRVRLDFFGHVGGAGEGVGVAVIGAGPVLHGELETSQEIKPTGDNPGGGLHGVNHRSKV